ncbi:MAG: DUF4173 domain-containing protein [Bacteroidota bacterium]
MKKQNWLLLLAALSFSLLFYNQAEGINYLVFDLLLLCLVFTASRTEERTYMFYCSAAATVVAGVAVLMYGNGLSVLSNVIALIVLGGTRLNPASSILLRGAAGIYSMIAAPIFAIEKLFTPNPEPPIESKGRNRWIALIPVVALLVFFALYRMTSPVFARFTGEFDLSFISIGFVFCTLLGFVLCMGLLRSHTVAELRDSEAAIPDHAPDQGKTLKLFGRTFLVEEENQSGVILLCTLNVLLLLVNGLDLGFLASGKLPEGMTYSEFVHQGTGALILSIVLAVAILLVYFRGTLNYHASNGKLKALAYTWILQNLLIVASTAYRNDLYINEYSLTYRRIGVYVFLLLAAIGLVATLAKIAYKHSNYRLFRNTSFSFYFVLLFAAFVPWDQWILANNLQLARQRGMAPDIHYLLTLSDEAIPELCKLYNAGITGNEPLVYERLSYRIYLFARKQHTTDWRSFNWTDYRVSKRMKGIIGSGKWTELALTAHSNVDLEVMSELPGIQKVILGAQTACLDSDPNIKGLTVQRSED